MESKGKKTTSTKRISRPKSNSSKAVNHKPTRRVSSRVKTVETVRLTSSNIRNFMPTANKDEIGRAHV